MLKRRISFILLVCFSLLLIPTRYWHECTENHNKKVNTDNSSLEFNHDDCFVCDFHFYTSDICTPLNITFEKGITPTQFYSKTSFTKVSLIEENLRGPPRS